MNVTATKAAREFSDLVNRVHYQGEEFIIERGGEPVCRLSPVETKKFTIADMVTLLESIPKPDPEYWDDLEEIIRNQPRETFKSPWES